MPQFTEQVLTDRIIDTLVPPFKKPEATVSPDSRLQDVLKAGTDKLFLGNLKWSLKDAGHKRKKFPSDWLSLTVSGLAKFSITLLILFVCAIGQTQVKVGIGAANTDLRNGAVTLVVQYEPHLDSIFKNQDFFYAGRRSWLMIEPEVNLRYGSADAFPSIITNITGLAAFFKTKRVGEHNFPDGSRTMHVFPVSVGIETDLKILNTVLTASYYPYYQGTDRNSPDWVKSTSFSLSAQFGHKFLLRSRSAVDSGGKVDESLEQVNSNILRLKGSFSVDTKELVKFGGISLGLVGNANGWYDAKNGAGYYQLQGILRLYLSPSQHFDFEFNQGTGAPLFNDGQQLNASFYFTIPR